MSIGTLMINIKQAEETEAPLLLILQCQAAMGI